ncbi:MAG: M67 family metallopeptidase, partial [Pseudomonadota bacterium]
CAMEIHVTRQVMAAIEEAARAAHSHECCGILLGADGDITQALPARNVHTDPATRFEIDPQALIDAYRAERKGGAAVLGFYHSHPKGAPAPSAIDAQLASRDGRIWAIHGEGRTAFFKSTPAGFEALSYTAIDP